MKRSILITATVFASMSVGTVQAATTCESLNGFAMKNVTITLAQAVGAGEFTPPPPARGAAAAAPAAAAPDGAPATPARGGAAPARGGAPAVSYRDLPAFCRVAATLTPVSDSEI